MTCSVCISSSLALDICPKCFQPLTNKVMAVGKDIDIVDAGSSEEYFCTKNLHPIFLVF